MADHPNNVGSTWNKWDLHIHTPASFQWHGPKFRDVSEPDKQLAAAEMIAAVNKSDVVVFAIQDYWTFDGYIVLRKFLREHPDEAKKCILPGIELRLEAPTDYRLNTHVIFSDQLSDDKLREFLTTLRCGGSNQKPPSRENFISIGKGYDTGKLKSHGFKPEDRKDDEKMWLLGAQTAEVTRESVRHAIELVGKENCLVMQPYDTSDGMEQLDWEKHPYSDHELMKLADIFEAKNPEVINLFLGLGHPKKPDLGKEFIHNIGGYPKPAVRGSDAHTIADYGRYPNDRITWLKAAPSFSGLKQVCYEPTSRCYIGLCPPKIEHVQKFPTKYIRSITIRKDQSARIEEKWFEDIQLEVNPGLSAIIGNKGSGKSALADIIALLGNTRCQRMEFLNDSRFRKGLTRGGHFVATLQWTDKSSSSAKLSDNPDPKKPERVRYLPQSAIENLCNEIAQGGGTDFEKELKKVIFFHVPEEQRLGKDGLDELLQYKTDGVRVKIRQMQSKLSVLNTEIVTLERETSEPVVTAYRNALSLKQNELDAHEKMIPAPIVQPQSGGPGVAPAGLDPLVETKEKLEKLRSENAKVVQERSDLVARSALIERLNEKLTNLENEFSNFVAESSSEFESAGLKLAEVVKLDVDRKPLTKAQESTKNRLAEIAAILIGTKDQKGLQQEVEALETVIKELQEKLDAPQKAYQNYLTSKTNWDKRKAEIIGTFEKIGTIEYLKSKIADATEKLPARLTEAREERRTRVSEIHVELIKLRKEYEELYRPVQDMASKSSMTKDSLQLHFDVFLSLTDFEERFFDYVNQGRRGSFYGSDEGRKALRDIIVKYNLDETQQMIAFLDELMRKLTVDERGGGQEVVDIASELRKDIKLSDFYDYLFALKYVEPRYTLRLGGKEIGQLSPGEKGALLLVFYLLLDREEIPIIIDQPEQNLDNESVVRLLVDCIKEARERRQVIIVTHNPNLAIVCDADQIICAKIDKADGHRITYTSGAIEHRPINQKSVDILEGTYRAFDNRKKKYMVPDHTVLLPGMETANLLSQDFGK